VHLSVPRYLSLRLRFIKHHAQTVHISLSVSPSLRLGSTLCEVRDCCTFCWCDMTCNRETANRQLLEQQTLPNDEAAHQHYIVTLAHAAI